MKQNHFSFLRKSQSTLSNFSFKDIDHGGSRTSVMRTLELKLPMGSVKTFCRSHRSHPCIARGGYHLAYSSLSSGSWVKLFTFHFYFPNRQVEFKKKKKVTYLNVFFFLCPNSYQWGCHIFLLVVSCGWNCLICP